jgi:nucleoid-associated protein YgaU
MTIGPLLPRPGMINAVTGGPLIVSTDTLLGNRDFATALRTTAAPESHDRNAGGDAPQDQAKGFNEYGFFANSGAIDIANLSVTARSTPKEPAAEEAAENAPARQPAEALSRSDPPYPIHAVGIAPASAAALGTGAAAVGDATALTGSTGEFGDETRSAVPAHLPLPSSDATATDDGTSIVAREVRVRPMPSVGARSPVSVSVDRSDDAIAITVSAYGLTDGESDALHADIVTLLRRHGLSLGDLRLNGRPMGQGRDRSGS